MRIPGFRRTGPLTTNICLHLAPAQSSRSCHQNSPPLSATSFHPMLQGPASAYYFCCSLPPNAFAACFQCLVLPYSVAAHFCLVQSAPTFPAPVFHLPSLSLYEKAIKVCCHRFISQHDSTAQSCCLISPPIFAACLPRRIAACSERCPHRSILFQKAYINFFGQWQRMFRRGAGTSCQVANDNFGGSRNRNGSGCWSFTTNSL